MIDLMIFIKFFMEYVLEIRKIFVENYAFFFAVKYTCIGNFSVVNALYSFALIVLKFSRYIDYVMNLGKELFSTICQVQW